MPTQWLNLSTWHDMAGWNACPVPAGAPWQRAAAHSWQQHKTLAQAGSMAQAVPNHTRMHRLVLWQGWISRQLCSAQGASQAGHNTCSQRACGACRPWGSQSNVCTRQMVAQRQHRWISMVLCIALETTWQMVELHKSLAHMAICELGDDTGSVLYSSGCEDAGWLERQGPAKHQQRRKSWLLAAANEYKYRVEATCGCQIPLNGYSCAAAARSCASMLIKHVEGPCHAGVRLDSQGHCALQTNRRRCCIPSLCCTRQIFSTSRQK